MLPFAPLATLEATTKLFTITIPEAPPPVVPPLFPPVAIILKLGPLNVVDPVVLPPPPVPTCMVYLPANKVVVP